MAEEITIVQHETGLSTYLLRVVESRVLSRQSFLQGTTNSRVLIYRIDQNISTNPSQSFQ